MNTYKIEQYETHVSTYTVEAKSEADAIRQLYEGSLTPDDNSTEYVEVNEDLGMPIDENRELASELSKMGWPCREIIESVRSIEEW